jgi:phytoene desaturase (3,4-didehydrolycopene-forming)
MPSIYEETFRDLGESLSDYLKLKRCDPNYRLYFHDGDTLDLSSDLTQLRSELTRYEGDAYEQFFALQKEAHHHYEFSVQSVLRCNFEYWYNFFNLRNLWALKNLHMHWSLYDRVAHFFQSDKLRKAFTFQAMYMGMSPFDAPATYSLLQYTEFTEGKGFSEDFAISVAFDH